MTDLPKGPTATELHARTLEECDHDWMLNVDGSDIACLKCGIKRAEPRPEPRPCAHKFFRSTSGAMVCIKCATVVPRAAA